MRYDTEVAQVDILDGELITTNHNKDGRYMRVAVMNMWFFFLVFFFGASFRLRCGLVPAAILLHTYIL